MAPTDFSGLVGDGFDQTLAPNVVIRTRPSVDSICRLGEIEAPTGMGVDDKQTVLRIEARRAIVGKSALVGRNEASVGGRFLGGIRNWTALLIDSKRPIHRPERDGQKTLPVGAVEHKEVAVARSLHQQLLRLAMEVS